jgi:hypothetical protein
MKRPQPVLNARAANTQQQVLRKRTLDLLLAQIVPQEKLLIPVD